MCVYIYIHTYIYIYTYIYHYKFLDCLILNMKILRSFKVLDTTDPSTNLHTAEDPKAQHRHSENLIYIVLKSSMTNYFDRDKLLGFTNKFNKT